jgi:hypothetical protein
MGLTAGYGLVVGGHFRLGVGLFALLALSGPGTALAHAEIHRCIGVHGEQFFTDRQCSALGARERGPEPVEPAPSKLQHPGKDCPRDIDDLQAQIHAALASRDINRLVGLYHWMDTSIDAANMMMPEFQAITHRRLISMEVEPFEFDGLMQPIRLWMDQYAPDRPGQTIRTGFNLVMNAGCWWLHGR